MHSEDRDSTRTQSQVACCTSYANTFHSYTHAENYRGHTVLSRSTTQANHTLENIIQECSTLDRTTPNKEPFSGSEDDITSQRHTHSRRTKTGANEVPSKTMDDANKDQDYMKNICRIATWNINMKLDHSYILTIMIQGKISTLDCQEPYDSILDSWLHKMKAEFLNHRISSIWSKHQCIFICDQIYAYRICKRQIFFDGRIIVLILQLSQHEK